MVLPIDLSLRIKTALGQALKECPMSAPQVATAMSEMLGQPVWLICVTVARIGEYGTEVNLDIAVAQTMLEGRPLPAVGDDIEALILLQGSIWIPAINSPAPDAAAPHPG